LEPKCVKNYFKDIMAPFLPMGKQVQVKHILFLEKKISKIMDLFIDASEKYYPHIMKQNKM